MDLSFSLWPLVPDAPDATALLAAVGARQAASRTARVQGRLATGAPVALGDAAPGAFEARVSALLDRLAGTSIRESAVYPAILADVQATAPMPPSVNERGQPPIEDR